MANIGDSVSFKSKDGKLNCAKIIKIINDDSDINGNTTPYYLLQDCNNTFTYKSEDAMDTEGENKIKKRKLDVTPSKSSKSLNSEKTIASAQNWYAKGEITKFKISFKNTSASSEEVFNDFFENIEINIEKYNKLIEGSWGKTDNNDSVYNKLLREAAYEFQVQCSEVSVGNYVRILLATFGLKTEEQKKSKFGYIDMICCGKTTHSCYRSGVIENKCGGAYDREKIKAHRAQLSSYLISIALSNQEISEERGKAFEYQNLIGIVHFGLTPIYYKTKISRRYLEVVQYLLKNGDNEELPKLEIFEFTPFDSFFCDREVYYTLEKLKIIKTYAAFEALLTKYDTEKQQQFKNQLLNIKVVQVEA